MKTQTLLAGLAALTFAGGASAALINGGGDVTLTSGTTTIASPGGIASASDGVIDGGGGGGTFGGVYTDDPNGVAGDYFSNGVGPIVFVVDLQSDQMLDAAAFFNRPGVSGNATQTFSIRIATDAAVTDVATHDFSTNVFDSGNLTAANTGNGQQDFAFGGTFTGRYVEVTISDNYFGSGVAGGDRTAFDEIQFNQVPEPGSLALLGLGGLLIARRRRG